MKRHLPELGLALAVAYLLPVLVYTGLGAFLGSGLPALHYVVATAYLLTSIVTIFEVVAARAARPEQLDLEGAARSMPPATIILAAYLPNEQGIIEETIQWLLREVRAPGGLHVICAYNTDRALPVQARLAQLEREDPRFTALRVEESTSKAQNINAALRHVRGPITLLLDADHHPNRDALVRGWAHVREGADVVQGRCVVRNPSQNRLTHLVAVEFEQMYRIAHTARYRMFDTALFGGTNGLWRTDVLRQVGMDAAMLTEDIDSTLRAVLRGATIVHDPWVISSELATATMGAWMSQRLRWAQGWLQVTMRHGRQVHRSSRLTRRQQLGWFWLLRWREAFPFLSFQIFALVTANEILGQPVAIYFKPYLAATAVVTLAAGAYVAFSARSLALFGHREVHGRWFAIYAALSLPYTTLRNLVAITAVLREARGKRQWVVTSRALSPPAREAPQPASALVPAEA